MNNRYPTKLNDLILELELFENPKDRIDLLIQYSEKFSPVPSTIYKQPYPIENRVDYCESEAYVWTELDEENKVNVFFAVENPQGVSAKALASILQKVTAGLTPEDVLSIPEDIVLKIFGEKLSMGKNLGLTGILLMLKKQVKLLIE